MAVLLDFLVLVVAGGAVGFAVGLTGVGGGSLMTPILLLMGYPAPVAIGTDLLYAGVTKSSGMIVHHRKGHVVWRTVLLMAAGSLPVTLLLHFTLLSNANFREHPDFERLLTSALGVMLLLTALVILLNKKIARFIQVRASRNGNGHGNGTANGNGNGTLKRDLLTFLLGALLGLCVTLSSVGAGAFGAAALFILLPKLPAVRVVGTDIAHAVPLTLFGGLSYVLNGLVDFRLLGALLCGSLPGIYFGSHVSSNIPETFLRRLLALMLFGLGVKFVFFGAH